MYRNLESKLCRELEALEEKYRSGAEMSEGDLRRIDLLVHSIKSIATYKAMKEAEEAQAYSNSSYANNNSYMNNSYAQNRGGQYVNRDMNQEMSGHYPAYQPMYDNRRW